MKNDLGTILVTEHKKKLMKSRIKSGLLIANLVIWSFFAYQYSTCYQTIQEQEMRIISKVINTVHAEGLAGAETSPTSAEPTEMKAWIKWRTEKAGMPWKMTECTIRNESGFNENAVGINSKKSLGVDLGIWQVNTRFHPNISNKDKLDYKKATEYAIKIWESRGRNYSAWYGATNCR